MVAKWKITYKEDSIDLQGDKLVQVKQAVGKHFDISPQDFVLYCGNKKLKRNSFASAFTGSKTNLRVVSKSNDQSESSAVETEEDSNTSNIKPKPPVNAYILFIQREKKKGGGQISKDTIHKKWEQMSPEEKRFYDRKHAQKMLKFQREMADYIEKYPEDSDSEDERGSSPAPKRRKVTRATSPSPKRKARGTSPSSSYYFESDKKRVEAEEKKGATTSKKDDESEEEEEEDESSEGIPIDV